MDEEDLDLKDLFGDGSEFNSATPRADSKKRLLSTEDKIKEQNRIRQLAFKAWDKMPKDFKSFCLVAAHLVKNAHRYWEIGKGNVTKIKSEAEQEIWSKDIVAVSETSTTECIDVNKVLREIRNLKRQNRITEQQILVTKLKEKYPTYRQLSKASGTALKTLHDSCCVPKERKHKATARSKLRQKEFVNFMMQDMITFSSSCKWYTGKRFMLDTWSEVFKKYLQQPEFHTHGVVGRSTMRSYKLKFILLSGLTPVSQCLCNHCENCNLMTKALVAAGVKGIPGNKYAAIEATLCDVSSGQFGTDYKFRRHQCINRECDECG